MEVRFRTAKLRRQYEQSAEAVKAYGKTVARRYIERVNILKSAKEREDLSREKQPTLRFHGLKGDRAGQFAIRLTDRWRLIVTFRGSKPEIVQVEEVSKHYGD